MIGWLKNPSPVSAFGRSTLSLKGRGEAGTRSNAVPPSPLEGEEPVPGLIRDARRADEGAFSEQNCAIWNDIRRALEGGGK